MPLFEFVCATCGQPFEELVRNSSAVNEVTCPACGSSQVKKKLSTFASRISGGGSMGNFSPSLGGASASSCNTSGT